MYLVCFPSTRTSPEPLSTIFTERNATFLPILSAAAFTSTFCPTFAAFRYLRENWHIHQEIQNNKPKHPSYVMLMFNETPGTCRGSVKSAIVEMESTRQAENPPWSSPPWFVCSFSTWNSASHLPSPALTIFTFTEASNLNIWFTWIWLKGNYLFINSIESLTANSLQPQWLNQLQLIFQTHFLLSWNNRLLQAGSILIGQQMHVITKGPMRSDCFHFWFHFPPLDGGV